VNVVDFRLDFSTAVFERSVTQKRGPSKCLRRGGEGRTSTVYGDSFGLISGPMFGYFWGSVAKRKSQFLSNIMQHRPQNGPSEVNFDSFLYVLLFLGRS